MVATPEEASTKSLVGVSRIMAYSHGRHTQEQSLEEQLHLQPLKRKGCIKRCRTKNRPEIEDQDGATAMDRRNLTTEGSVQPGSTSHHLTVPSPYSWMKALGRNGKRTSNLETSTEMAQLDSYPKYKHKKDNLRSEACVRIASPISFGEASETEWEDLSSDSSTEIRPLAPPPTDASSGGTEDCSNAEDYRKTLQESGIVKKYRSLDVNVDAGRKSNQKRGIFHFIMCVFDLFQCK